MANTTADKLALLKNTKQEMKSAINDPTLGDKFSDYPDAVINGKAYIAEKITAKGVTTSADATFQQIGDNIDKISSGKPTELGVFTVEDTIGGVGPAGEYQFEIGMTWSDFIDSSYNRDGFFIDAYGAITCDNPYDAVLSPNIVQGDFPLAKKMWPIMNNSFYDWTI